MEHWDVTAFVRAPLEETVYLRQPEGWIPSEKEGYVFKLKKALYGLKQAARAWQIHLRKIMVSVGGVVNPKDDAIFIFREGEGWCFVGTHVDDIFPVFNKQGRKIRDKLWKALTNSLEIKNLGQITWALSTSITRTREGISVSQENFTRALLREANMDGKGVNTPAPESGPEAMITEADLLVSEQEKKELSKLPFLQMIGSFWWLAQITRPDILYATHRIAKHQNKPCKKLWGWIQRVLKYLVRFPDTPLFLPTFSPSIPVLQAYVDAAFNTEEGSKSRTGWVYLFLGAPVAWSSEVTTRIVSSSTEAECRGVIQLGKENVWMREFVDTFQLFPDLEPTIVYEDNSSTIFLSTKPSGKLSKHFGLDWDMAREMIERGEMKLVHVPTDNQWADIFTKSLPNTKFGKFRDLILGGGKTDKTETTQMAIVILSARSSGDEMSSLTDTVSEEDVAAQYDGPNGPRDLERELSYVEAPACVRKTAKAMKLELLGQILEDLRRLDNQAYYVKLVSVTRRHKLVTVAHLPTCSRVANAFGTYVKYQEVKAADRREKCDICKAAAGLRRWK